MIIAQLAFIGMDFATILRKLLPNPIIVSPSGSWKSDCYDY